MILRPAFCIIQQAFLSLLCGLSLRPLCLKAFASCSPRRIQRFPNAARNSRANKKAGLQARFLPNCMIHIPYDGLVSRELPFTSSLNTIASAISFIGFRFCRLCRCNAR
jgi:hypothetical protein